VVGRRWVRLAPPLTVAALTAACFLPALSGSFLNWDDGENFLRNDAYRGLGAEQVRWAFTSVLFGHYIPLTRLTFSLNFVLGGMDPWGYHLLNLLLHAANAALLYAVARRILAAATGAGSQDRRDDFDLSASAAVAAIVFGIHPLRVEPVAWISARPDLLCATFALLTTWAYLHAVEHPGPARRGPMVVAALALAAALLSKGVALSIPFALLLLDVYPLRRLSRLGWRPLISEKIPVWLTLVPAAIVVYGVRHETMEASPLRFDAVARVTVAAYSFVISLARFLWPFALSPLNEMPTRISAFEPRFGFALVAAICLTGVLIVSRRRWPSGLAAWAFSVLVLAPTSAALRPTTDLAPDRYSYLSGLGFAVLVGGAVLGVIRLVRRGALARPVAWVGAVAGSAVLAGLAATSWSYSEVWRQPESLWRWAVEVDPACSVCHEKLGASILAGPGGAFRLDEAEGLFRRAIALRPDLPNAYINLGTALIIQGRYAEAEAPLLRYIERAPGVPLGPERLGHAYLLQKRYADAIPLLRTAFRHAPERPPIRSDLAAALQGRAQELRANGRLADAEPLLAESRAVAQDGAPR